METKNLIAAHLFELVQELEAHINDGWRVDYSCPPVHVGYYSATIVKGAPKEEEVVEHVRKRRTRNEESA